MHYSTLESSCEHLLLPETAPEPFTCTEFALLIEFSPECHALKIRWQFNLYVM